jgi:hypothetical protein
MFGKNEFCIKKIIIPYGFNSIHLRIEFQCQATSHDRV